VNNLKPCTNHNSQLVSIIMAAYNAGEYIKSSVQSVLDQDYSNWELIIINDGSSDETANIVRSFTDSRITCLWQKNMGVSAARNRGLEVADGEYLTFLDADDELPPSSISSRVAALKNDEEADIADGVFEVFDSSSGSLLRLRYPGPRGPLLRRLLRLDESIFRNGCYLFRRKLLGDVRFCTEMKHAEDLLFFIEMAAATNPIFAPVQTSTYSYRLNHISAMTDLAALEKGYFQLLQNINNFRKIRIAEQIPTYCKVASILFRSWVRKGNFLHAIRCALKVFMKFYSNSTFVLGLWQ
jgi:glycosyltransferase involved in cell wall biosynthesis